jgi:hypothetical protein
VLQHIFAIPAANTRITNSKKTIIKRPKTDRETDHEFAVGEKLKVKLQDGRVVDATVRAIVDDGKLQTDLGHEENRDDKNEPDRPRMIGRKRGEAVRFYPPPA